MGVCEWNLLEEGAAKTALAAPLGGMEGVKKEVSSRRVRLGRIDLSSMETGVGENG